MSDALSREEFERIVHLLRFIQSGTTEQRARYWATLEASDAAQRKRIEELSEQLEFDRTAVASCMTAANKAIDGRHWLTEGRGPYEWDDDKWHSEFYAAAIEIKEALGPLTKIATSWKDCPMKGEEVAAARVDLKKRIEELEYCFNLLAVMCEDGGHYLDANGIKKTVDDCIIKYYRNSQDLNASQASERRMREALEKSEHARTCKKRNCECRGMTDASWICPRCPCDCHRAALSAPAPKPACAKCNDTRRIPCDCMTGTCTGSVVCPDCKPAPSQPERIAEAYFALDRAIKGTSEPEYGRRKRA